MYNPAELKRLLTCLFLVTALVFSISTKANALFFSKYFCINNHGETYYFGKASKKEKCNGYALSKKNNKQLVNDIGWMANKERSELMRLGHPNKSNTLSIITSHINKNELYRWKKWNNSYEERLEDEAKNKNKRLDLLKDQVEVYVWVKHVDKDFDTQKPYRGNAKKVIYNLAKEIYTLNPKDPKEDAILIAKEKCWKDNPSNKKGCLIDKIVQGPYDTYLWNEELAKYNAKKESTQTQLVAKKEAIPEWFIMLPKATDKIIYARGTALSKNSQSSKYKARINALVTFAGLLDSTARTLTTTTYGDRIYIQKSGRLVITCTEEIGTEEIEKCKDNRDSFKWNTLSGYTIENTETQQLVDGDYRSYILLKYPIDKAYKEYAKLINIKKKEKKKVAKVVEQEQEEFKPKKKDIDTDPPIIEIAEAITVDNQSYTLEGKVKDKSEGIYLTIDGRPVEVKRGKFTQDRFNIDPEIVEEIKIVAIDKWNNKSEMIVKVTVKLKATEVVRVYEDLKPNKVKVSKDDNKIAIIIGIEKYENLTNIDAKFANNDAKAFRAYAERALGVKSPNVKILIGKKATRSQTLKAFKLWLPKIAGEGKDIYIFFAGHGLASDNGKDLYILPQDGESSLLEDTAISRVQLISLIQKVNPKSVTMFFDTCYSGQTRGEQMLVASLRPIRIVAGEQDTPNNFTIFSASNFDQTSGSIEETKHGMFSYYLMKGLEGKADGNKDKQITNGELIAYLKTNVSKEAFIQNREQDPMLSGDPNQVLMRY